jgi:hypothetical protein
MSDFKGIGAAPAPKRTTTFTNDGTYIGKIMKMKKHKSENPKSRGEMSIILEIAIVEVVESADYITPIFKISKQSNKAGEVVSQFLMFKWYSFFDKLKTLLCAMMEISPEEAEQLDEDQWIELAERAVEQDGTAVRGSLIKFRANTIAVGGDKIAGTDPDREFTVITYLMDGTISEPVAAPSDDIPF